uniref:ATP synthase subunit a n=1 Tax=Therophilus festivus TaxID=1421599 RepID=A0A0A6ZLN8_9HYME|nr:ATP synthase F0 subunit 6 [Therophilus festivus]
MMMNYFNIFDPSTNNFILNWISSILGIFILPQLYWMNFSRLMIIFNNLLSTLFNEFKLLLIFKFNYFNLIYFLTLFFMLLLNNFLGLFPFIFTSSSHLVFSLYLSLSLWLSMMLFGWMKNYEFMFIHLVPMNTPFMLMFFMVMIETLSNLIRPLTLSVRLVANMIAGHLLLVLLSSFIPDWKFYLLFLFIQLLLMGLEFMVSLIQSYVFSILLILYLKETN